MSKPGGVHLHEAKEERIESLNKNFSLSLISRLEILGKIQQVHHRNLKFEF